MGPFCDISTFKIPMHFYIEIKKQGFNISIVTHFVLIIIHVHIFQIKIYVGSQELRRKCDTTTNHNEYF